jgi:broad specificity phosphatase PhoE
MRKEGCISLLISCILLPFTESFVPSNERHLRNERHLIRMAPSGGDAASDETTNPSKRIVFIRHGRTYMNDYIGGLNYGTPNFSDIFPDTPEYNDKYKDSPLTPKGIDQAKNLHSMLQALDDGEVDAKKNLSLSDQDASFLNELELVVVSPLTRALQTMEIALHPVIRHRKLPVMAVPLATERVYLIAEIGKTQSELKKAYSYVDFDTAFPHDEDAPWYFTPSYELTQNYVEWRPNGEGQVYACLGEPQDYFDRRMSDLYRFLEDRQESTIAVVCHAGVIDWFLQEIFENCELRVVKFENLKPRGLITVTAEEEEEVTV